MWGTLLIVFYLARDTVYRWFTRLSSPLARLAVVFFLSLCGLVFLSSYVVSVKVLRQRIHRSGANLVVAAEYMERGSVHRSGHGLVQAQPELYDLYLFHESFVSATIGKQRYSLVEYMPMCTLLFPETRGNGMYLLPVAPVQQSGPEEVSLDGYSLRAVTIPEKQAGILRRLYREGAVFIPYGSLSNIWQNGYMRRHVLRMKNPTAQQVQQQENALSLMGKLDKRRLNILSSGKLLEQLGELESTQYSFRVWITLGISAIICLLLTSISSLEFQQNRYIYALIGSFGINRFLLFLSFLVENAVLVAVGFAASLTAVWGVSDYITRVLYKSPEVTLTLWELEDDIRTFLLAFGICVLVSSIPIGVAACRPIGKVLK